MRIWPGGIEYLKCIENVLNTIRYIRPVATGGGQWAGTLPVSAKAPVRSDLKRSGKL